MLSITRIIRRNFFFKALSVLCMALVITFIIWNISALVRNFDNALEQAYSDSEKGDAFDIMGFEKLNLIRNR